VTGGTGFRLQKSRLPQGEVWPTRDGAGPSRGGTTAPLLEKVMPVPKGGGRTSAHLGGRRGGAGLREDIFLKGEKVHPESSDIDLLGGAARAIGGRMVADLVGSAAFLPGTCLDLAESSVASSFCEATLLNLDSLFRCSIVFPCSFS